MSRKRVASIALPDVERLPVRARTESFEYEYIRPGIYSTPQVETIPQTTMIYTWDPIIPWISSSPAAAAGYMVDGLDQTYYLTDLECQQYHRMPCVRSLEMEMLFNCYPPQIDEEDYYDPPVSPCKRERFIAEDEEEDNYEQVNADASKETTTRRDEVKDTGSRVYRDREGYLVEEPMDSSEN